MRTIEQKIGRTTLAWVQTDTLWGLTTIGYLLASGFGYLAFYYNTGNTPWPVMLMFGLVLLGLLTTVAVTESLAVGLFAYAFAAAFAGTLVGHILYMVTAGALIAEALLVSFFAATFTGLVANVFQPVLTGRLGYIFAVVSAIVFAIVAPTVATATGCQVIHPTVLISILVVLTAVVLTILLFELFKVGTSLPFKMNNVTVGAAGFIFGIVYVLMSIRARWFARRP